MGSWALLVEKSMDTSTLEMVWDYLVTLKIHASYGPTVPLLGVHLPKGLHTGIRAESGYL